MFDPLQGGRGSFAAEDARSAATLACAKCQLQGGRGSFAAEDRALRITPQGIFVASMRPRQLCRGRSPRCRRSSSMFLALQGGRGSFAAEDITSKEERSRLFSGALQGGRGSFAAEDLAYGVGRIPRRPRSFNEAAAALPRKMMCDAMESEPPLPLQGGRGSFAAEDGEVSGLKLSGGQYQLQGGRGSFAAEDLKPGAHLVAFAASLQGGRGSFAAEDGAASWSRADVAPDASMRPRQLCRGRCLVRKRRKRPHPPSFNEAAAALPRKIASKAYSISAAAFRASMRPRQLCRGRSRSARQSTCGRRQPASMRPRQLCRGRSAAALPGHVGAGEELQGGRGSFAAEDQVAFVGHVDPLF